MPPIRYYHHTYVRVLPGFLTTGILSFIALAAIVMFVKVAWPLILVALVIFIAGYAWWARRHRTPATKPCLTCVDTQEAVRRTAGKEPVACPGCGKAWQRTERVMTAEQMNQALLDCPHCASAAQQAKATGKVVRCEIHVRRWIPESNKHAVA